MRRGFTLIELCFVLAVLAVLTAMAVPAYRTILLRARAAEAPMSLDAIAQAEVRHFRDHGAFLACPATGPIPAPTATFPGEDACWRALGMRIDGDVRYRYAVALEGTSYVVTAEGDLDRDGVASEYRLNGQDLVVTVRDGLE